MSLNTFSALHKNRSAYVCDFGDREWLNSKSLKSKSTDGLIGLRSTLMSSICGAVKGECIKSAFYDGALKHTC
jgi:hypothetical protein